MMRILITGGSGFLGSRLMQYYQERYEVWAPSHGELDFTDAPRAALAVAKFRPDVVLHCAAVSDVGACERDPGRSHLVNVMGTQYLAKACAQSGARFVLCSSDQVYFRGQKPGEEETAFLAAHREEETLSPQPVYGQQKLEAERLAFQQQPDSVALRLTWMYGPLTEAKRKAGRGNLLTMLEEAMQSRNPVTLSTTDYRGVTDVDSVVRNMEAAWQLPAGVYNFGSAGDASLYETVRRVMAERGQAHLVRAGDGAALRNLTMDPAKLAGEGIEFPGSEQGLATALHEFEEG